MISFESIENDYNETQQECEKTTNKLKKYY